MNRVLRLGCAGALVVGLAACGKKAPPLAPLRPTPERIAAVTARRVDDRIELRFTVPAKDTDGTTPASIARVNVYAMSTAAGDPIPSPTQVVTKKHLIGHLEVQPAETPDAAATKAAPAGTTPPAAGVPPPPPDPRPKQGDIATYVDTPPPVPPAPANPPPAPKAPAAAAPVPATAGAATAATPPVVTLPSRVYSVAGVTAKGREAAASELLTVWLTPPPPAPQHPKISYDQATLTLTWEGPADVTYRVYAVDRDSKELPGGPLTPTPLTAATFQAPVKFGVETCLVVRALSTSGPITTESAASERRCETPVDTFPPPAPTGLKAVPDAGQVSLVWDAVDAADLGGYIVLRREVGSEKMQPLMPAPIADTKWDDKTTRAGVQYEYAVIAVDQATPPNRSPESPHQTVTARAPAPDHKER